MSIAGELIAAGVTFQVTETGLSATGMTPDLKEKFRAHVLEVWCYHIPEAMEVLWPTGARYAGSAFWRWMDKLYLKSERDMKARERICAADLNALLTDDRSSFDGLHPWLKGLALYRAAQEVFEGDKPVVIGMDLSNI